VGFVLLAAKNIINSPFTIKRTRDAGHRFSVIENYFKPPRFVEAPVPSQERSGHVYDCVSSFPFYVDFFLSSITDNAFIGLNYVYVSNRVGVLP
jgi:hypothetical protein